CQGVVDFVTQHANNALPRLPLFLAQGATYICKQHELMLPATLVKEPATHFPASGLSIQHEFRQSRNFSCKTHREAELLRRLANESLLWLREQAFTCNVHNTKRVDVVECKHGNVDFGDHTLQECRRIKSAESAFTQLVH